MNFPIRQIIRNVGVAAHNVGFSVDKELMKMGLKKRPYNQPEITNKDTQVLPKALPVFFGGTPSKGIPAKKYPNAGFVARPDRGGDVSPEMDRIENSKFTGHATKISAIRSYKKGGMVHKTGPAMLHKGEMVVPKHMVEAKTRQWMMSDDGVMKG